MATYGRDTIIAQLRATALMLKANIESHVVPHWVSDMDALEDVRSALRALSAQEVP